MTKYKHSVFPLETEDNYILSTKSLLGKAKFYRRNKDSQNNNDGTSDTSSSVKEKKMLQEYKSITIKP